jgi:hypothetical protein
MRPRTSLPFAVLVLALLAAPAASAAPLDACSAAAAQALPVNQLVAVPDILPGTSPPTGCEAARFVTIAVKVGDRLILRAAGGTDGLRVGFVSRNQLIPENTPPYEDFWAGCRLDVEANHADEIRCTVSVRANALLQVDPSGDEEHGGQIGVWISHPGRNQHAVVGQCNFLGRPPIMRLQSVQYANLPQACSDADPQFPAYQRWRVRIRRSRELRLSMKSTTRIRSDTPVSNDPHSGYGEIFIVKPHTDPADYRLGRRDVCVASTSQETHRTSAYTSCHFRKAGMYTIYALAYTSTVAFKLR